MHARTQKERVPDEAKIGVFSMSFDFFTSPQGARTPDNPPYANPGLRPYTPPVKNIPGGPPPPSNDGIIMESLWNSYYKYNFIIIMIVITVMIVIIVMITII